MYIFASFVVSYDDDGGDGDGDFWFDTLDKWLYKWQTQNNNKYIFNNKKKIQHGGTNNIINFL